VTDTASPETGPAETPEPDPQPTVVEDDFMAPAGARRAKEGIAYQRDRQAGVSRDDVVPAGQPVVPVATVQRRRTALQWFGYILAGFFALVILRWALPGGSTVIVEDRGDEATTVTSAGTPIGNTPKAELNYLNDNLSIAGLKVREGAMRMIVGQDENLAAKVADIQDENPNVDWCKMYVGPARDVSGFDLAGAPLSPDWVRLVLCPTDPDFPKTTPAAPPTSAKPGT
jgi:hypothetical protein